MKTVKIYSVFTLIIIALVISSCGSLVTLTSWKDPAVTAQISKVAIMPLFDKLEYMKPFEQAMDVYFDNQGLKAVGSLDFLNPNIKYSIADIKKRCDSLGVDAILVIAYKGTDKTENYVPPTTFVEGGYGGYWGGGYWGNGNWGGGYWGGAYGGNTVTTGGYWTTTSVVNLKASLYVKGSKDAIWTGEVAVTDPNYVDQAATAIARDIYNDWGKYNLLKQPVKK
jgi:hypothetical protein